MTPRVQAATLAAGAATAGAMAVVAARNLPVPPPAHEVVPALFSGCVSVVGGVLVARWRPSNGAAGLLVAIGLVTMLSLLAYANSPLPFTIGGLVSGVQLALALHLVLALPDGRLIPPVDTALVALVYGVTLASKVLPNLFLDCTNPWGFGCPGNLLLVRDDPDLVVLLDRVVGVVGAVVVLLVAARVWLRWRSAGPTLRRVLSAPYAAAVPLGVLVVAGLLGALERFGAVATLADPLVLSLLPAGVLLGILRTQARSGVVGPLVTAVEPRSDAVRHRLEPLLAKALGDPALRLLAPEEAATTPTGARARTPVTSAAGTLAVLEHDPELASEPEVLDAVVSTAGLVLENGRLVELSRRRLEEVAESRRRLASAQVEERRRLERNLHDGAQQRLVTVRFLLAMAVEQGAEHELVEQAATLLEETTAELRDLARGMHPSVVTEHGISGAVEALAERAAVPVEVRARVPRVPQLIEVTTYFVVSEALTNVARHAGATHARVEAVVAGGTLRVVVADDGEGGADWAHGTGLSGLRDRVEAAGGSAELHSPAGGGTRLEVRLPVSSTVDGSCEEVPG